MLIVPIYTLYMNPAEIGYYDLIVTLVGLICPVIMLSIHEGYTVGYWNLTKERQNHQKRAVYMGEACFTDRTWIYSS